MRFTGTNLLLVRYGLACALDEVKNEIATCPDPEEYIEELKELNKQKVKYSRLLAKVDEELNNYEDRIVF